MRKQPHHLQIAKLHFCWHCCTNFALPFLKLVPSLSVLLVRFCSILVGGQTNCFADMPRAGKNKLRTTTCLHVFFFLPHGVDCPWTRVPVQSPSDLSYPYDVFSFDKTHHVTHKALQPQATTGSRFVSRRRACAGVMDVLGDGAARVAMLYPSSSLNTVLYNAMPCSMLISSISGSVFCCLHLRSYLQETPGNSPNTHKDQGLG